MRKSLFSKYWVLLCVLLGAWIGLRYALPILFPFLLGGGLALAAEPMVKLLSRKLPRAVATGIGVTLGFVLLISILVVLVAILVRQAARLSAVVPNLMEATRQGLGSMESWLLELAAKAPQSIRDLLTKGVVGVFSGSDAFMEGITATLLGFASGLLGFLTDGTLGFVTGILSAFMISAKLPQIREFIKNRIPKVFLERYLPLIKGLRGTVLGWFSAQCKLTLITAGLLFAGFWLLRIDHALLLSLVVALVDAFPILGTGMILVPWSLICFLQGQQARALGLLGLYAVIWLTRSVLEPKLLGKELGLDPLVTLIAVYAGLKLFGFVGMLLAPILAVTVVKLVQTKGKE